MMKMKIQLATTEVVNAIFIKFIFGWGIQMKKYFIIILLLKRGFTNKILFFYI